MLAYYILINVRYISTQAWRSKMGYTLYTTKYHDVLEEMETGALVSITEIEAQKDLFTELLKARTELQAKQITGFEIRLVRWDSVTGKDIEILAKLKGGSDE